MGDQRDGQNQFAVIWQVTGIKTGQFCSHTKTGRDLLYTSLFTVFSAIKKSCCCSLAPSLSKFYAAVFEGILVLVGQEKEESPQK